MFNIISSLDFCEVCYIHTSESTHLFTLACPHGYYGNDCRYQCSPYCYVTHSCDNATGLCEGGCKPGWTGYTCDYGKCLTILSKRIKLF